MNLKNGKLFMSKFVGTGPSSYDKRIYLGAFSQGLWNTGIVYFTCSSMSSHRLLIVKHLKYTITYHLPEDLPSGSKHVEGIRKLKSKILINKRCLLLVFIV